MLISFSIGSCSNAGTNTRSHKKPYNVTNNQSYREWILCQYDSDRNHQTLGDKNKLGTFQIFLNLLFILWKMGTFGTANTLYFELIGSGESRVWISIFWQQKCLKSQNPANYLANIHFTHFGELKDLGTSSGILDRREDFEKIANRLKDSTCPGDPQRRFLVCFQKH